MSQRGGFSRFERLFLVGAVFLIAVVVLYGEYARIRGDIEARARDTALAEELDVVRNEARAAFSSLIPRAIVEEANKSVYAIVVNGRLFGTAFVVDRENGVLATAAHVADALPLDEEDARISLFNRFDGKPFAIKTIRNHAGYGAFRELIEDYQPIRPNTPILKPQVLPLRDLAFDAALVTVDPIDEETGENRLGADLPVAARDAIFDVGPGAPIAVIGFPYDTLDDSIRADVAISRVERGVVSAMIAPLDTAVANADPIISNLIVHRLSTAGGSSGSPVINASGEVVGIHTHGIESISGNADGAAQRADVLRDLLVEGRDELRLNEVFVPAWTRRLEFWRSAKVVLPWSFYLEREGAAEAEETLVSEIDQQTPTPFSEERTPLTFAEPEETYTLPAPDLTAPAPPSTPGEKSNIVRSQAGDEGPIFRIDQAGEYATARFTLDRSKNNLIFAFDYSLRRKFGFCRLKTYWRRIGEQKLAVQAARASTELYFPMEEGGGLEEYELVFRRISHCDPASSSFYASVMTWVDGNKAEGPGSNLQAFFFPPRDHEQLGVAAETDRGVRPRLARVRCAIASKIDNKASCLKSEFIEVEWPASHHHEE